MDLVAVIINVRTDLVATLALASLRRNAPELPVRLINCEPSAASRTYFAKLADNLGFEVVEDIIRDHGDALDHLFRNESSDLTLLLDSDAELLGADLVPRYLGYFENEQVFGAGFVHGPGWLGAAQGHPERVGYYQERPWLPFVILRTEMVRQVLAAGCSFADFTLYNDFAVSPRLSRKVAGRFPNLIPDSSFARLPPGLRKKYEAHPLDRLAWLRRDFYGQRPNYVFYDTGASIYQHCKYQRNWIFAGIDARLHEKYVGHYHGVTRLAISGDSRNATAMATVADRVSRRLAEYGLHELPVQ
jgi:hypothetical protein